MKRGKKLSYPFNTLIAFGKKYLLYMFAVAVICLYHLPEGKTSKCKCKG